MFQMPWPYGPFMQPQQRPMVQVPGEVGAAFRFLDLCRDIQGPSVHQTILPREDGGPPEVQVESIDGRKLESEEAKAKMAALGLLRAYFDGTLKRIEKEQASGAPRAGVVLIPMHTAPPGPEQPTE